MTGSAFTFRPLTTREAEAISAWRYSPPYDFYNLAAGAVAALLRPDYHYYAVLRRPDELIGFRCFGADAQVQGGDYSLPALDMGGGMRPDLTGQGLGGSVVEGAMEFALGRFRPVRFRATVASSNERAIRVCVKVGYVRSAEFERETDQRRFTVFCREVGSRRWEPSKQLGETG